MVGLTDILQRTSVCRKRQSQGTSNDKAANGMNRSLPVYRVSAFYGLACVNVDDALRRTRLPSTVWQQANGTKKGQDVRLGLQSTTEMCLSARTTASSSSSERPLDKQRSIRQETTRKGNRDLAL